MKVGAYTIALASAGLVIIDAVSHITSSDDGSYVTLTRYLGENCTDTRVVLSGAPTRQCIAVYDSHHNYSTIASTILDCNSTHITTHIYNDNVCADFNTSFIKGFAEECYDNNKEHYPVRFSHEIGNLFEITSWNSTSFQCSNYTERTHGLYGDYVMFEGFSSNKTCDSDVNATVFDHFLVDHCFKYNKTHTVKFEQYHGLLDSTNANLTLPGFTFSYRDDCGGHLAPLQTQCSDMVLEDYIFEVKNRYKTFKNFVFSFEDIYTASPTPRPTSIPQTAGDANKDELSFQTKVGIIVGVVLGVFSLLILWNANRYYTRKRDADKIQKILGLNRFDSGAANPMTHQMEL